MNMLKHHVKTPHDPAVIGHQLAVRVGGSEIQPLLPTPAGSVAA